MPCSPRSAGIITSVHRRVHGRRQYHHRHHHGRQTKQHLQAEVWLDYQFKPPWMTARLYFHSLSLSHDQPLLVSKEKQGDEAKVPSQDLCPSFLEALNSAHDLCQVKHLHERILALGIQPAGLLGESLVASLAKYGGLDEALQVFYALPRRTASLWTAIISGFTQSGQGHDALEMYQHMQVDGVEPNRHTYISLFKACGMTYNVELGRKLHVDAQRKELAIDVFVGSTIVSMYGKCGSLKEAELAFKEMSQHDVVSWNVMLSAYIEQGQAEKALEAFGAMQNEGMEPNKQTFLVMLQACGATAVKGDTIQQQLVKVHLESGYGLHANAVSKGFTSDAFVGSTLVSMYGKCGAIIEAENVLCGLSQRNIVSWTAMLSAYLEQGLPERALLLYRQMQEELLIPDKQVYLIALQACIDFADKEANVDARPTKVVCLEIGKALHSHARRKGFSSDAFVISTLVSMYGSLGSYNEAENIFSMSLQLDIVLWTAMLMVYVEQGLGEKALHLYCQMQAEGVSPDQHACLIALRACMTLVEIGLSIVWPSLDIGQALHADACMRGFTSDVFVGSSLVNMYGKCGAVEEAENVFVGFCQHDCGIWNSLLSIYVEQGLQTRALRLYRQMENELMNRDVLTFIIALQACAALAEEEDISVVEGQSVKLTSLKIGQGLHADARKKGLMPNVFLESAIMNVYSKCGIVVETERMFSGLTWINDVAWNIMLSAYVEEGLGQKALQLYRQIQLEGTSPSLHLFVAAIQACGILAERGETAVFDRMITKETCLEIGQALHFDAQGKDFISDAALGSSLMIMYSKCGNIEEAESIFSKLSWRDAMSWSVLMSVYVKEGKGERALQLYRQMQDEGVIAEVLVFAMTLQACIALTEREEGIEVDRQTSCALEIGQALHADALRKGFCLDTFLASSLISMYGKCGALSSAEIIFGELSHNELLPWNAMLLAYAEHGQAEKALQLFKEVQGKDVRSNKQTFVIVLQACAALADYDGFIMEGYSNKMVSFEIGQAVHADALKQGFFPDAIIGSALVGAYSKCGCIKAAETVFNNLPYHDSVLWNGMLLAYVDWGHGDKALSLYREMQEKHVIPNDVGVVCILQACSETGSLDMCRRTHCSTVSAGCNLDFPSVNSLIHAYASCGSMVDAQTIFDGLCQPDIASWNACIAGYAKEGSYVTSLQMFERMQLAGVMADEVAFLSVLTACSHAGITERGLQCYGLLTTQDDICFQLKHFSALVDLFGRAGDFDSVERLILRLPIWATPAIWLCLLGACRIHGHRELAKLVFTHAVHDYSKESGAYILMSNVYADVELSDGENKGEIAGRQVSRGLG